MERDLRTIYCISDSVGLTVQTLARAATAQFHPIHFEYEVLPDAVSLDAIYSFLRLAKEKEKSKGNDGSILSFYTVADPDICNGIEAFAAQQGDIIVVDLLGAAVEGIAQMTGLKASNKHGTLREADSEYFKRVEAVEFAVNHDDGRNPQDLSKADIVLIGVSRTSKTPLSIYLAQEGYCVANVPLDLETSFPPQIEEVDKTRLFGLMTSPEILIDIRRKRLGKAGTIAAQYAEPEYVYQDLEESRKLMLKLGCKIIHTENRAVEETAREILRYYERTHGI